jgi:hypothetical protein
MTTTVQDHRCPHCTAGPGQPCTTFGGRLRPAHSLRRGQRRTAQHQPRRYVLNDADPRFGLVAGDVLVCEPYRFDPGKGTVLYRESDRYDPGCNVYWSQVTAVPGRAGLAPEPAGDLPAHGPRQPLISSPA